jgi:hypothetical protein
VVFITEGMSLRIPKDRRQRRWLPSFYGPGETPPLPASVDCHNCGCRLVGNDATDAQLPFHRKNSA